MNADTWKQQAAERAITLVEDGMVLGLGTGSTAARFVDLVGQRVRNGLKVICVPTSEARACSRALGIPLATLDEQPFLNLTVDGADEVDDQLRLIKGGGGALLCEKIVATASDRMVVISDASKRVANLGRFPLPVEVVRFGLTATRAMIEGLARTSAAKAISCSAWALTENPSSPTAATSSSIAPSAPSRIRKRSTKP